MKVYNESVLVVPADEQNIMGYLVDEAQFLDRNKAEIDEEYRQVIPYTVILNLKGEIFTYKRLSGDSRLTEKWSIGVGGHINDKDAFSDILDPNESLKRAAAREIDEELDIEYNIAYDLLAGPYEPFIRLSETPVDRVHVGLVYILLANFDVKVKEVESLEGKFMKQSDIPYDKLENWSKEALHILAGYS
jgi:predicted NUDIX family phosphoesterase